MRLYLFLGGITMKKDRVQMVYVAMLIIYGVWFSLFPIHKYVIIDGLVWLLTIGWTFFLFKRRESIQVQIQRDALIQRDKAKHLGYEMSVAASQVSSASESLFVTIEENTSFSEHLFAKAQEMTAQSAEANVALLQTIEAVNEVLNVLEQVEDSTGHLRILNDQALETIKKNLETILSVVDIIGEIQIASHTTKDYMGAFNEATEEIVHILNTVSHISRQTHLLALNASIESARAGEAGKGFSVVADEIRLLSNRTSQAVQDVSTLFDTIKDSLRNVNKYVDLNVCKVEEGVMQSQLIEESLEQMQQSFTTVTSYVKKIVTFSQQEVQLAAGMNHKMKEVEQLYKGTVTSVEDVCDAIATQKSQMDELSGLGQTLECSANDLNTLIEVHKLNDLSDINLSMIEEDITLFQTIMKELSKEKAFIAMDKTVHERKLKTVKEQHEFVEAIWTNTKSGRFLVSIPPAGISNANIRTWFKEAINRNTYVSEPYISAITKNPCVTVSAPLISENGLIVGVMGIDIKIG